jgi:hypothetical protein
MEAKMSLDLAAVAAISATKGQSLSVAARQEIEMQKAQEAGVLKLDECVAGGCSSGAHLSPPPSAVSETSSATDLTSVPSTFLKGLRDGFNKDVPAYHALLVSGKSINSGEVMAKSLEVSLQIGTADLFSKLAKEVTNSLNNVMKTA